MPNLSKETIDGMRRVIKAVKANAAFYNQNMFPVAEDCGTTCCAAGFAVWLNIPKTRYKKLSLEFDGGGAWAEMARDILGIDSSMYLFSTSSRWPAKFAKMYERAKTPKDRALALEACWEHFIKKDGDQNYYGSDPASQDDEIPF